MTVIVGNQERYVGAHSQHRAHLSLGTHEWCEAVGLASKQKEGCVWVVPQRCVITEVALGDSLVQTAKVD